VTERAERPDVLVVESLALFREVEAHYLSRVAIVRTAGNAAAAVAAIELRRPQLVVTSLDLPDRPGEELVRMTAVGLCGSDVGLYLGTYEGPKNYPIYFGHEWSGVVEADMGGPPGRSFRARVVDSRSEMPPPRP